MTKQIRLIAGGRATMLTSPLITSDESFSPRPASSSSRHLGSRPGSPVSVTFNNNNNNNHAGNRYSPPCALDLTPKQTSALAAVVTTNHIMSAYLPPAFTGLMTAGPATSVSGLTGHGPSFGSSGKCFPHTNLLLLLLSNGRCVKIKSK